MFTPFTVDLYLPALPGMNVYFNCSASVTNLTLSVFFISYALGILIWGPISDKLGRRLVIMTGNIIYIICSIICSLSFDIYMLILARLLQGIGSGAILAASTAIIKDSYTGKKRESILAVTQSISGLAPMIAPMIGAVLLKFTDWRGCFWALAALGILNLVLTILYTDTLKEEEKFYGALSGSFKRLIATGRNMSLMLPTLIFALTMIPFMGYIAVSSYIYIDYFGTSEQVYSYFFAANALVGLFGPILYIRCFTGFNKKAFAALGFSLTAAGGIIIIFFGSTSPIVFVIPLMLATISSTMLRPYSTNIFFDQQKGDTGSVSAIFNTTFTVLGSIGMVIASIGFGNIVISIGLILTVFSLISLLGWIAFIKSGIPCAGVKN